MEEALLSTICTLTPASRSVAFAPPTPTAHPSVKRLFDPTFMPNPTLHDIRQQLAEEGKCVLSASQVQDMHRLLEEEAELPLQLAAKVRPWAWVEGRP